MVRLLHELAHHPNARNLLGLLRAGHTAAAPPSSVMKSRRLMSGMALPSRQRHSPAYRTPNLPQSGG